MKTSDSAPSSSSILSKSSTSSFSESGILETTNNEEDESVAVESTANSAGEVQTNKPKIKDIRDSGLKSSSALKESETEAASISESRVINTVSPTLSAESLLSDELVSESINLSEVVIPDVSDEVVTSSQQTSVTSSSSSSSPLPIHCIHNNGYNTSGSQNNSSNQAPLRCSSIVIPLVAVTRGARQHHTYNLDIAVSNKREFLASQRI